MLKVLRMIYRPVCERNEWRIRFNHELYSMYKERTVVKKIRKQQLRWLGHVHRMSEEAPPKKIAFTEQIGVHKRKPGRQKLRWLDCIEKELRSRRITNWKEKSSDRTTWRGVIGRL